MSVSTDGHISFGILLDEDFELPWQDADGDDDIEAWWHKETGYTPPYELFGPDGNYLPHIEKTTNKWSQVEVKDRKLVDDYFTAQREWDKAHPLPVEMVNTCSNEIPVWIIAVSGTVQTARRGYPQVFNPNALNETVNPDALAAFTAFCAKYGIAGEPAWYLGSYWG